MIDKQKNTILSNIKIVTIEDLFIYCKKNNILFSKTLLLTYGFTPIEINILNGIYETEIKMINELVEQNLKNKIKSLTMQLKYCETKTPQVVKSKNILSFNKTKMGYQCIASREDKGKTTRIHNNFCYIEDLELMEQILNEGTTKEHPQMVYRDIVAKIIKSYNLKCSVDAFNGGKNRSMYYFEIYYYPLKVLEHLGKAKLNKRGTTTLIYK